jgi:hypothetical protein
MTGELPAPAPIVTFDTQELWDGTKDQTLVLRRCGQCGVTIWFPRPFCPDCGSVTTSPFVATGLGVVYSFTVVARGMGPYAKAAPFVVAYVELEEGPRVLTNIVECDPGSVTVGMPVEIVFNDTGEGPQLFRFRPRGGGASVPVTERGAQ